MYWKCRMHFTHSFWHSPVGVMLVLCDSKPKLHRLGKLVMPFWCLCTIWILILTFDIYVYWTSTKNKAPLIDWQTLEGFNVFFCFSLLFFSNNFIRYILADWYWSLILVETLLFNTPAHFFRPKLQIAKMDTPWATSPPLASSCRASCRP
jgi:hypothetical protein